MRFIRQKNTVGGDAIILTISRTIVSIIGVLTSMLLARFRSLEEFGTYSQIIMVTDLATTFFILGLPNSINYFLVKSDTKDEKVKFLSIYFTLTTILTMIIGVSLGLATPIIVVYFENPLITTFCYVFVIYPWTSIMINSLSNVCIVYKQSNRLIYYNIVQALSTLLLLLYCRFFDIQFYVYVMLFMSFQTIMALFAVGWVKRIVGTLNVLLEWKFIKKIFIFSIPIGLASMVGTINTTLDKMMIGYFFTTEEYAIYANASKELPLTMLATSFTAVLLPMMVYLFNKGDKKSAIRRWGYSINISLSIMTLFVGGLIAFAPDVMSLFYSQKYVTDDGVLVFRIYSLILLFRCTYWGIALNALGKTKFILISSILSLVANLLCNAFFYGIFGFIGPAIATLVVTCIMNIVQVLFTCKALEISFFRILPWIDIAKILGKSSVFCILFYCIKYYIKLEVDNNTISILISLVLGGIWAILYFIFNYKKLHQDWNRMNNENSKY